MYISCFFYFIRRNRFQRYSVFANVTVRHFNFKLIVTDRTVRTKFVEETAKTVVVYRRAIRLWAKNLISQWRHRHRKWRSKITIGNFYSIRLYRACSEIPVFAVRYDWKSANAFEKNEFPIRGQWSTDVRKRTRTKNVHRTTACQ